MNRRKIYQLIGTFLLAFSFSILVGELSLVRAQSSELGSFEESEEGNLQPTETNIESTDEWREQQEQKLEQELNIGEQDPDQPKVEFAPNPDEELGLDDNEPFQNEGQEVEVQF